MNRSTEAVLKSIATNLGCKLDHLALIGDTIEENSKLRETSSCWRSIAHEAIQTSDVKKLVCPSLTLLSASTHHSKHTSSENRHAEFMAVENLARPRIFCNNDISFSSRIIGRNVIETFISLVRLNLRQYFKINYNYDQARATQKADLYLSEKSSSSPITFGSIITSFDISDSSGLDTRRCHIAAEAELCICEMASPIDFGTIIEVNINGETVLVSVEVPGTITGYSHSKDNPIVMAQLQVDTNAFLSTLRSKARMVVWKAVEHAQDNTVVFDDMNFIHVIDEEMTHNSTIPSKAALFSLLQKQTERCEPPLKRRRIT